MDRKQTREGPIRWGNRIDSVEDMDDPLNAMTMRWVDVYHEAIDH